MGSAWSARRRTTGAVRSFWITVPIFLLGAVAGGVLQPVRQTYLHRSIPTSERATLVSFDSLVGSLGSVGGQTGLGYLSQERSIPVSFVVGGRLIVERRTHASSFRIPGGASAMIPAGGAHDRWGNTNSQMVSVLR